MVDPEDTEVLHDSNDAILTLVTCYPFSFVGPAPWRFVVQTRRILNETRLSIALNLASVPKYAGNLPLPQGIDDEWRRTVARTALHRWTWSTKTTIAAIAKVVIGRRAPVQRATPHMEPCFHKCREQ